jgi:muconate cycloisomerase
MPTGLIQSVSTLIVDMPFVRAHKLSRAVVTHQSYLVVQVWTSDGVVGTGEAVVPGGPWWGGEAVESMKALVDRYLAPQLIGLSVLDRNAAIARLDRVAFGNPVAKSALEVALWDAAGRLLGVPISTLLGGRVRDEIPCLWALGIGERDADVAEAQEKLEVRQHNMFKIKVGFAPPAEDFKRVIATAEAIGHPCSIDYNEALDASTALQYLPRLDGTLVEIIEQPVARANHAAMAAMAQRLDNPIMVDEGACSVADMGEVVRHRAADAVSLKLSKSGGIAKAQAIATLAHSAGIALYGGTALDSSIGAAASLQFFASLPALRWGCELIGPLLLTDYLTTEPLVYADFGVRVPTGPGIGLEIDPDKLKHYTRKD